jgi:NAD(P)-dependent dehydrogenase (short-subunit alcohol dehydrogenase family)
MSTLRTAATLAVGAVLGVTIHVLATGAVQRKKKQQFSNPDQPARHAQNVKDKIPTTVDIDSVFCGQCFKGKRVLVTGAARGLGLVLCKELVKLGAEVIGTVRKPGEKWDTTGNYSEIAGIELTSEASMERLVSGLGGKPVDVLINNAGYFYGPQETLDSLNFEEELKMIDICAVGNLRVTGALYKAGLLATGAKVSCITSQGGSVGWRDVQCPNGGDYGHHMSKSAQNMAAKLLANELKPKGVAVSILHPGFNRTDMTAKYSDIWDEHGAVEPEVGARRVLHQIDVLGLKETGKFINCEDGREIPW